MAVQRKRRAPGKENGGGRGLGNVETNIKKSATRWKRTGWVKFEDGEAKVVRVLDVGSDFRDGFVHPVEFDRKGGKSFTKDVMCLDQDDDGTPCPGCRDELERRYKFWCRVIEREAEVENDSGKVTAYEDQVKILSSGKRLAGALNKKHRRHDLSTRDIEIEREGTGWDTDYSVEWVDEKDIPLTKDEIKMVEEGEIDLDRYAYKPDFDDFYELPGRDDEDDDDEKPGARAKRGSAFGDKTRRKSRASDNGDDDDDDDKPRRRGRTVKSGGGLADMRARKQSGGSASSSKPTIKRRRTR